MKKLVTILAVIAFGFSATAQDYKPSKGTVTTEVGLTGGLFDSAFNLNSSVDTSTGAAIKGSPTLKFRYFLKDNVAFRLGFAADRKAKNDDVTDTTITTPVPTPVPAFTSSTTNFKSNTFFGINLGIEKHFKGSDRLSTFVGADLLIGTKSSFTEKVVNSSATTSTKTTGKNIDGASYFGLGLLTGADYYIAKKVYLGVELGFSMLRLSEKDSVNTTEITNGSTITTKEDTNSVGGSEFEFTTAINGGVRIGYQF